MIARHRLGRYASVFYILPICFLRFHPVADIGEADGSTATEFACREDQQNQEP
jgi:hypothetical protein